MTVVNGAVYIKAVMDHKYDGLQVRDLTVTLVRRRPASHDDADDDDGGGDEAEVDTLREAVLRLPVYSLPVQLYCELSFYQFDLLQPV